MVEDKFIINVSLRNRKLRVPAISSTVNKYKSVSTVPRRFEKPKFMRCNSMHTVVFAQVVIVSFDFSEASFPLLLGAHQMIVGVPLEDIHLHIVNVMKQ